MSTDAYAPEWEGPVAGWAVNHAAQNVWRVSRDYEVADLIGEAYVVYARCAKRYPALDTPQHFMSLFQRAFSNRIHDLANANTRRRREVSRAPRPGDGESHEAAAAGWVGELDCDGELAVKLRQAPSEVKQVLALFLNAPQELLDIALGSWRGEDRRRADGGSEAVNRLLGLPQGRDILKEVRDYFS